MRTVGAVPFLNAKPLVDLFDRLGQSSPVDVLYAAPAKLPAMLDGSSADAILVSSIEALTREDARAAAGVSISSFGPVRSVRLFTKVPLPQIKYLALDERSMTSNALCRIILAEAHKSRPLCRHHRADLHAMLEEADAALLIGDMGMQPAPSGVSVLDLGEAWTNMTGLPFVWALWVGEYRLDVSLARWLVRAREEGEARLSEIAAVHAAQAGLTNRVAEAYLRHAVQYGMDAKKKEALALFCELALEHDLAREADLPRFVEAEPQVA